MQIILALILSLLASIALAQQTTRPTVPPSNRPQNQPAQQQTAPDKRGTADQPFIIKEQPREYSDDEKQQSADKAETDRELVKYTADLARYTKQLSDYTGSLYGATFALAVLTGLLWFFTAMMWWTTRRAVRDGERAIRAARRTAIAAFHQARSSRRHVDTVSDTAKRQLRAYVFAIKPEVEEWKGRHIFKDKPLMAKMIIKNTGQTPAYEYRVYGGMCIRDYRRDSEVPVDLTPLDYDDPAVGRGMLGPGAERQKNEPLHVDNPREHRIGPAPTLEEIRGLDVTEGPEETGEPKAVFVYGEILYRDEFETNRWTTYCFISNRNIRGYRGDEMAEYKFGNHAGADSDGQQKPAFCAGLTP